MAGNSAVRDARIEMEKLEKRAVGRVGSGQRAAGSDEPMPSRTALAEPGQIDRNLPAIQSLNPTLPACRCCCNYLACIPADDNDVCTSSSNSYNPTISASIETLLSHPSDILSTPKKFDARPCLMGLLTLLQPCLYQIQSTE